ncbi:MAG: hypothetical protein SNJ82_02795, partial [Gemmataceae bacterium]
MPTIRCKSCGLLVQVPVGGRRLCGCGTWLSADELAPAAASVSAPRVEVPTAPPAPAVPVAQPVIVEAAETGPRLEGDLSAIERLNDGYRRIRREIAKAIVGQEQALEELLIAIFARGHCLLVGVPG